jgi:hypothetical protein
MHAAKAEELIDSLETTKRPSQSAPAAEPVANSSADPNGSAQPRGWLTPSERETLQKARSMFSVECHGEPESWNRIHERWRDDCDAILARNSPPEVVKPNEKHYHHITCSSRDADWIAALAAAGVKVCE